MAEGAASSKEAKVQLDDIRQTVTCNICLQLFSDPRGLSCSHTYCLVCLKGFQKSSSKKDCPICRANTIPGKHELDNLPVNQLATNLVKLVHTREPTAVEEAPTWQKPGAAEDSDSDSDSSTSSLSGRLQALLGLSDNLDMLRDLLSHVQISDSDDSDDGRARHVGIKCDSCQKSRFSGARFKCGICPDFDLCEGCEKKPRMEVHQTEYPHVFVKLKKPSTTPYPREPILHEEAGVMGMTMDVTKQDHVLNVTATEVKKVNCHKCEVSPIKGTRFKCGVCEDFDLCEACEEYSEQIHDEKHPFLVFKHPVNYHTTKPQLVHQFY